MTLTVVGSRTEAELAVGLLRSYGLRAAVAADDAGGQEPQLQLQGVRVRVHPDDEEAARQILAAETEEAEEAEEADPVDPVDPAEGLSRDRPRDGP